ncbi:hypothetical protein C8T65DRAFT_88269 [Cerioporus squamosus]|nr:hypothetical protein C8T65DRAFT_88269 [Cerioporus squamosus]
MACTPTPTQTLYEVLTTTSVSTSFTDITSTIPADISTVLSTFCASSTVDANDTDSVTTCLSTGSVEVVTTLRDEEITTIPSQVVFSIPVIFSEPTATLFSTCSTDGVTSPPPPSDTPTSQTSQTSQTLSPPPSASVIVSQVSSTLPGGSVVVTLVTSTSTMPPAVSTVPTSLGSGGSDSNNNNADNNNIKDVLGPAIGGAVGGFLGLIALVMLVWFIWRRRDSIRALYAKEPTSKTEPAFYERWGHHDKPSSPPPELEPRPYQYGLVGRRPGSPSRTSSPSTSPPPTRPQSLAFTGVSHSPGPYTTGYPYNPPTPNSASGLAPSPSPYSPYFPQQPPSPAANGLLTPSARPHTPVWPESSAPTAVTPLPQSPQPPPAPSFHRQSDSMTSVGTAVSYPFPVLPPVRREERDERRHSEDESSVSERDRRPFRLSLTLANWNPETDGELFPRASSDDGRPEHGDAGQGG